MMDGVLLGQTLGQSLVEATLETTLAALAAFIAWVGGGEKVGRWFGTALAIWPAQDGDYMPSPDRDYLAAVWGTYGGLCGRGVFRGFIAAGGNFDLELVTP